MARCGWLLGSGILTVILPCLAQAQDSTSLATATALQRLVTEAIERAEKSVVSIARVRKDQPPSDVPGQGVGVVTERSLQFSDPTDPKFVPTEFGTGVVIDDSGLILTNHHVLGDVRQADFYVWINRRPFRASVKAADPWLDLALLKVENANLKAMPFGDTRNLKKGQFVITLGNPHAIARDGRPSAALGIISNLQRQAPPPPQATRPSDGRETLHQYGTLIQTDARLELGSSGGALVNLQGEMIGLTTSLAALYGYERPGGFAIPLDDDVRRAIDTLKTGRLPDYGLLGVEPAALALDARQRGQIGVRVRSVHDATPAKLARFQEGDVITHFDKSPIADDLELIRRVSGQLADTPVTISILRGSDERRTGRPLDIKVKLTKKRIDSARESFASVLPPAWRGLRVEYATAAPLFAERSRDLDPAGCIGIIEVDRDSSAWKAGLRPGDFVSHIAKERVTTPHEFQAAVLNQTESVQLRLTGVPKENAIRTVPPEAF
jgi:serine protease Do